MKGNVLTYTEYSAAIIDGLGYTCNFEFNLLLKIKQIMRLEMSPLRSLKLTSSKIFDSITSIKCLYSVYNNHVFIYKSDENILFKYKIILK